MYNAGQAEKDSKRVVIEPLTRKERYNAKAAMTLKRRDVMRNVINKTAGTKSEGECRSGHVTERSLAVPMERGSTRITTQRCRSRS